MTGARAMGGRPPARRRPWRIATALAGVVIVMGLSACTPTRWQNELASVNAAGTDSADAASWGPQLSPDGTFRFIDLASGEYTVIAAGYPPVATVLQMAGGGRTERDLQLGHED